MFSSKTSSLHAALPKNIKPEFIECRTLLDDGLLLKEGGKNE